MAQLDTGGGDKKGKGGKVRSKKNSGSVDLTAMVDLAFLLITFFMLTTTLSKPQSMTLNMPDKEKEQKPEDETKVDENRMLTILVGSDNHLMWYMGQFAAPLVEPQKIEYGKDGIRKELLERIKAAVAYSGDPKKGLVVVIKPSDKSNYRNLIDMLDEMAITKVPTYAIVDITKEEVALLEREKVY